MHIRIKGLADGGNWCETFGAHDFIHLPHDHTQGLLQCLAVHGFLVEQGALDVVHDSQYFLEQGLFIALHTIHADTLLAFAEILHVGAFAQVFIPVVSRFLAGLRELGLQFLNALAFRRGICLLCHLPFLHLLRLFHIICILLIFNTAY